MGISGNLELLQMTAENNLDKDQKRHVESAFQSVSILIDMVNSLLDVSRLEAGEMPLDLSICDLGSLVNEALDLVGSIAKRNQVSYEPPQEPASVTCDSDLIRRVITNIVGNGLKFIQENGEVRIEVKREGENVRVAVTDTGPGIPPEYHDKIFEKFGQVEIRQQKQKYSTGLGLTFCKQAVEAHGGLIGVDSELGKGSTFWFKLPFRIDAPVK